MGHGLKSRGQLIETMSGEDRVARSQKECESKGGGGAIGPMVRGGKDSWGEGVGEISGGDGGGGGEGGGGGGGGGEDGYHEGLCSDDQVRWGYLRQGAGCGI